MISFAEAKAKVKAKGRNVNHCEEYDKAFLFWNEEGEDGEPIAVMKDNGQLKSMIQFSIIPDNELIREIRMR